MIVSCGAAPKAASPTPTPVSGPRVEMPSGAVYAVEVSTAPEETAQGLMYREGLAPRTGMIFLFSDDGVHNFWMKNTMIPLDIIWMDAGGRILFVSENTPPCRSDPCPNYGPGVPAPIVLEIAGGLAATEGVRVGSTLKLHDIPLRRSD